MNLDIIWRIRKYEDLKKIVLSKKERIEYQFVLRHIERCDSSLVN